MGYSVSANRLPDGTHTIFVDSDDLDEVTGVNVSLGNGVNDVLGGVLDLLLVLRQHLNLEVVTNKLVVKNRRTKLTARALNTISELIVATNGIIAIDLTLAVITNAAEQVEGVVGHEPPTVQGG